MVGLYLVFVNKFFSIFVAFTTVTQTVACFRILNSVWIFRKNVNSSKGVAGGDFRRQPATFDSPGKILTVFYE